MPLDKRLLGVGEVVQHQAQRLSHLLQRHFRIFTHHMNLNALLAVVLVESQVVLLEEGLTLVFLLDLDGHGPTHDRHAVVEGQNVLPMQIKQDMLNHLTAPVRRNQMRQFEVTFDHLEQFAKTRFDQQIRATQSCR